jgi:hypothetical protein
MQRHVPQRSAPSSGARELSQVLRVLLNTSRVLPLTFWRIFCDNECQCEL